MNHSAVEKPIRNLPTEGSASVRILISDANWLESSALEQLKHVAKLPGMRTVVGMPDLHPGKGQPIGAAFITDNVIYPHLVGSDIGCGMALWTLDWKRQSVPLDKWEKRLLRLPDLCDEAELEACCKWLTTSELTVIANCMDTLGSIGAGNHFVEVQQVARVWDSTLLDTLGLRAQSLVLLVHSGSRGLGQRILTEHVHQYGASGLTEAAATEYLNKHDGAHHWATVNRRVIALRISTALGIAASPLVDVSHNHVCRLTATVGSEEECLWIHRKGAAPTDKGLVVIPGSRGSSSYLVQPCSADAEAMSRGGFSVAHGAGRKWKRTECKGKLQQRYTARDLETTPLGSRVICKARDLLYEEAPQAYKNVDVVIDDLVQAGMVKVVARFTPLLTYKTSGR